MEQSTPFNNIINFKVLFILINRKLIKRKKENETSTLSNKSLARDNSYNKKKKIEKLKSLKGGATNPKEITDEYIDRLIN